MLSPDQSNPNHQFDQLPPQLENPAQVEQLPLLLPPTEEKGHTPLLRREWTARQKGLAVACGFAALSSLGQMIEGDAHAVMDALHGDDALATVRVVDGEYAQNDPLAQYGTRENQSDNEQKDHHAASSELVPEAERAEPVDWFDFAKDLGKKPEPFKPNIPRHKLPFPIDETTAPKSKAQAGKQ